jgi:hypothetical protein
MVKLDVRRDYYADLGLAPNADPEDVKRQFRKLGEERLRTAGESNNELTLVSSQIPPRSKPREGGGIQRQVPGDPVCP